MVERCEKMKKGIVVDLDGTLLQTNTFKDYIIFVIKEGVHHFKLHIAILLFFWVLCRKLRLITHETMKYQVLRVSLSFMTESRLRSFVSQIETKQNMKVVKLCQRFQQEGYYMLLSTAAPENYVQFLYSDFLFDYYCASPLPTKKGTQWRENVREQKKNNTLEILHKENVSLEIMITDHYDDLPLLEEQKKRNILVSPSTKTIEKLSQLKINYDIIK